MTGDKSNNFVLITVSLTLLISIAVPTSMCSQLLGITLCCVVPAALVSSSAVVFIPPPLIELSAFSCLIFPCNSSPWSSQPPSTSPTHLPVPALPPRLSSLLHSSLCCCLPALVPSNQLSHRHNPTWSRFWYFSKPHCKTKPTHAASPLPHLPPPPRAAVHRLTQWL